MVHSRRGGTILTVLRGIEVCWQVGRPVKQSTVCNRRETGRFSFLIPVVLLSLGMGMSAHSSIKNNKAERLYNTAVKNYYILNASKQKQQYRDVWFNVIDEFGQVYKKYPDSSYAPKSLYNIGNLYNNLYTRSFLEKDLDDAVSAFKTLQEHYKKNTLSDDALFKIAEIYRTKKGDTGTALKFYQRIIEDYPERSSAQMARVWVKKLGGSLPAKAQGHKKNTAAVLKNIKVWSAGDYTRVVINVSNDVVYSGHLLEQTEDGKTGKRVYVDLDGTMITCDIPTVSVKDGLVEEVRTGQFNSKTTRVVLDVGNIDDYSIFNLEDPFRIIIDVKGKKTDTANNVKAEPLTGIAAAGNVTATEITEAGTFTETAGEQTTTGARDDVLTISKIIKDYEKINQDTDNSEIIPVKQIQGISIRKIVIDPGHGGHDPGAIGRKGTMEKNVTLAIGTMLADRLKDMGFKVIMTRDKDVYIPLEERTAIANMSNADLFISIHANASRSRRTKGITTYYLSPTRDRASMIVAARENATSTSKLSDLQLILDDLMKTAKLNESAVFAQDIQSDMVNGLIRDHYKTTNLGVRSAPFFVLMHADMPSILIETSFITNPREEKLLTEKRYDQDIINGIIKGILQYGSRLKTASQ